jgi:hypothetical protein
MSIEHQHRQAAQFFSAFVASVPGAQQWLTYLLHLSD